jgi:uncharacterized protein (TIGR00369 family)
MTRKHSTKNAATKEAAFLANARIQGVPVAKLIGFEAHEIHGGRAVILLKTGPQHANPMGTLHGGILCDIADAAMGMALASTLLENESFTTIELKINFLRPVWQSLLRAEGTIVHRGNTMAFIECNITDEKKRLIARASSTCLILRGEKAQGR